MKIRISDEALKACCEEVLNWQSTGLLVDGELRKLAASLVEIPEHYRLGVAEKAVADAAMKMVIHYL